MSCYNKAKELYDRIGQGQMNEAFEDLYADNCKIIEADGSVREGKDAQREAIKMWQTQMVKEFHGGGVHSITANEDTNTTCVECWTEITNADGHRFKMEEVAVQNWEDGKIVKERFYYNMP